MFSELGARRRRLRAALGDRGQSLFEFGVMSALVMGSLGLILREWMPAAAPWGFALPFLYVGGYVLLDWLRQRAPVVETEEAPHRRWDLYTLGWTLLCASASVATLLYAWGAEPPPPPEPPAWQPPEDVILFDAPPPAP